MMFKSETAEQELLRIKEWHKFFAWLPEIIGEGRFIWLESVERRLIEGREGPNWGYEKWEYRRKGEVTQIKIFTGAM